MDKVNALYAGADDYIVKPFHEQEALRREFTLRCAEGFREDREAFIRQEI